VIHEAGSRRFCVSLGPHVAARNEPAWGYKKQQSARMMCGLLVALRSRGRADVRLCLGRPTVLDAGLQAFSLAGAHLKNTQAASGD